MLLKMKKDLQLDQVYFFDTVTKNNMPEVISSMDAAIIPLKKLDIFLGAIPSKIFESLAMKKPIILGVDGEAKELFINKGECGLFYEPENIKELSNVILKLAKSDKLKRMLGENGRNYVEKNFNRDTIADDFNKELRKCFFN